MPSVPGDSFQLAALLFLVLPGTVYQFARARLRGPAPDDASALNRVLRALGVSALLTAVYILGFGPHLLALTAEAQRALNAGESPHVRQLACWAIALFFVVPSALALADHLRRVHLQTPDLLKLTYDPSYPGAWDFAFSNNTDCYVRILTTEGRWIGGWYSSQASWASSYPEPREVFIEEAYRMGDDGSFGDAVPGSAGVFVRCDDVRLVEFVDPTQAP